MSPTALLPVRTVAPAESLLSTGDAKTHLRVDDSDNDAYIAALVAAAEGHLDGFAGVIGRALVTQTWSRKFNAFPCGPVLRLPLGPLQSVSSVTYYDTAGTSQTFASTNYRAVTDAIGPCVVLDDGSTWPNLDIRPDAVTITWVCGYGAAGAVPAPIIHAAKLIVGHLYGNREATIVGTIVNDLPMAVDALIAPYRAVGI
ncbi:MAG: hypothetical protein QOH47_814 [Sphingomonadales bacterium]|jgi:uncharacterized phiE125 gp8 family phage protein|nr:hypothetical protein [Sphingomonadales bacterium]